MRRSLCLLTALAVCHLTLACSAAHAAEPGTGFLQAKKRQIVDGAGDPVLLRSIGLGGWMLQEGYMLRMSAFANPQHEIRAAIEDVIGEPAAKAFYRKWRANGVTRADIRAFAGWGFNSVRLPMHYNLFTLPVEDEPVPGENTWLKTGFKMTDELLEWCEEFGLYLILDLHAAPGGQGHDAGISDYDSTKPSLWESKANRDKTVALWRKLAERYRDEPAIAGYDLVNEPNWDLPGGVTLRELYVEITEAIRQVDPNHIIFIEGNWWANDFTGLTPPWDDNLVYSFHKYWSFNDRAAINWVLKMRKKLRVPLWMGEAGENSTQWNADCVRLLEKHNIGWAWWPAKKLGINGLLTVKEPPGYQSLLDYWEGRGPKPAAGQARKTLAQLTRNLKFKKCEVNREVVDSLFRLPYEKKTLPFVSHSVPGKKIQAVDYDLGLNGHAYFDNDAAAYWVSDPTLRDWNRGWSYRADGVDIYTDPNTGYPYVGGTDVGEWLQYTVTVNETGDYRVLLSVAAPGGASRLSVSVDGEETAGPVSVPSTGGWERWQEIELPSFRLEEGPRKLRLRSEVGGFNVRSIELEPPG